MEYELKDEAAFFEYYGCSSREDFFLFFSKSFPCFAEKEYALARELWYILERVEPFSESEMNDTDKFTDICDIVDASLEYGHIDPEMHNRLMYFLEISENPLFGYLSDLLCVDFSFFKAL